MERRRSKRLEKSEQHAAEHQRGTKRPRQTSGVRGAGAGSTTPIATRAGARRGRGNSNPNQAGGEAGQEPGGRSFTVVRGGQHQSSHRARDVAGPSRDTNMEKESNKQDAGGEQQSGGASGSGPPAEDARGELRRMAESGLQGILKSFGRIEDLLGPGQHSGKKMKDIIEALNSQDPDRMRTATDELNNLLNNTAEDAYSSFPIEQIMPALVGCMSVEVDPETNMKAIRCLGVFARSLPSSCSAMVRHGAIPALCTRLLTGFDVIDVAEEAIRALKYISQENPEACLLNGAMCAVLCFLDFLSHHEQRDAVESAANMCKGLKPEHADSVMDQVPNLVNLLAYSDVPLVEKASMALLRISEAFASSPKLLKSLSETVLITKILEMICAPASKGPSTQIKASTYFSLIRVLTICSAGCPPVSHALLEKNISDTIKDLLHGATNAYKTGSGAGMVRTPEQLTEVISLADSLLPSVEEPKDETERSYHTARTEFLSQNAEIVVKFGQDLLPLLLEVHSVTVSLAVRAKILSVWSKVVHHIDAQAFKEIVKNMQVASFLSPLLNSPQDEIVLKAMVLVEALMNKLPDVFSTALLREGVVHQLHELGKSGPSRRSMRIQAKRNKDSNSDEKEEEVSLSPEHCKAVALAQKLMDIKEFKGHRRDTEGTKKLKELGKQLNTKEDDHKPESVEKSVGNLLDALNTEEGPGVSVFEFLESSIVPGLNDFLHIEPRQVKSLGSAKIDQALGNVKMLVMQGLIPTEMGSVRLKGLIHKLKEALAASEKFPVRHVVGRNIRHPGPASRTGSDDIRGENLRLASLGQPLKLKLYRAPGETELKDISLSQVLVEPLVMVQALEQYLWQKVCNDDKPAPTDAGPSSREQGEGSGEGQRESAPAASREEGPEDSEAMSISHEGSEEGDGETEAPFDEEDDLMMDEMGPEDEDEMDEDDGVVGEDDDIDDDEDDEPNVHVHNVELTSEPDEEESEDYEPGPSSGGQSYAQAARAGKQARLEFCIGDVVLGPEETVFRAVRQHIASKMGFEEELEGKPDKLGAYKQDWEEPHPVMYRKRVDSERSQTEKPRGKKRPNQRWLSNKQSVALSMLQQVGLPEGLDVEEDLSQLLLLLKLLETVNRIAPRFHKQDLVLRQLSRSEFVSSKLTTKLVQQLKDPLTVCSGCIPSWCQSLATSCKFLFPFEYRRRLFYANLDQPHVLQFFNKELEAAGERKDSLKVERGEQGEVKLSKLKVNKVRVSRSKILPMALKIMEMFARNNGNVIEVQYFNECGVGEGPTLEFFTLVSHDIQKRELKMWRTEEVPPSEKSEEEQTGGDMGPGTNNSDYVFAPQGLFPMPYPPNKTPHSVLKYFRFLGRTLARGLLDMRLMDLDLNPLFFRVLRGEQVDLFDVKFVDRSLGMTLEKLQAAYDKAKGQAGPVMIDGSTLDEMYLTFTLPGYPEYELRQGGGEFVRKTSLQAYIDCVVNASLVEGIEPQVQAFKSGFEEVMPVESLDCFYEDEMDLLLRGTQERWTVEKLTECVSFSHGYSPQSEQAQWFIEILAEMDGKEQRRFLQFLTGSPRLPPGGIASLSPKLTVVQRLTSIGSEGDSVNDLPSVATCVNFLKLPKYASKEVMKQRLTVAINEGQFAFDLS